MPTTVHITDQGNQSISGVKTFANNIQVSGTGIFNAVDLNNIDIISLSGVDISITNANIALTNRPTVNGTGVLLSGEFANLPDTIVYTTGDQTINGNKTFQTSQVNLSESNLNFINTIEFGPEIYYTNDGNGPDEIDNNLQLTRGYQGSIYNPLYGDYPAQDSSNLQYYTPVNTMWNNDGWSDLTNLKNRNYKRFYDLWGGGLGYNVPGSELIMLDTYNNKYHKVQFSNWQQGGGGLIEYTRQLVTIKDSAINSSGILNINLTATTGTAITFTQPDSSVGEGDNGSYEDNIDTNLAITRGYGGVIYNSYYEGNQAGQGGTSAPYGTEWNIDGWSNLHLLKNRTYNTLYNTVTREGENFGQKIVDRPLVMHDKINDKYYLFKFSNWQGGGGGGFSYIRSLVAFNENQINFGSPTNFIGSTSFKSRPFVNGIGVLLSGEAAKVDLSSTVRTTGTQAISGSKTFVNATTFSSETTFTNNITVVQTGIFSNMDVSVDEMSISGLNLTVTNGTGIFNNGIDLNNSTIINAAPQIINVSSNFIISGNYNSRMIMANSSNTITGRIVSGNAIGFNTSIIQTNSGQVFITGSGVGIIINSYNNQFRTAGQYATISMLHTGNNGYIMYGNTST